MPPRLDRGRSEPRDGRTVRLLDGGQLADVLANGYWHARTLDYSMSGTFHALEWIRVAGDLVFLVLGALPIAVAAMLSFLRRDVVPGGARA